MQKTLAMKVLEGRKIKYDVLPYDAAERDAVAVARAVAMPPSAVYKTLVVDRRPEKSLLVLVQADQQLDLKKLAKAVKAKKLKMATHTAAESLTGLQVGGITPLALLNKGFRIIADVSMREQGQICVSSGQRGLQIRLAAKDLLSVAKPRLVDVSKPA